MPLPLPIAGTSPDSIFENGPVVKRLRLRPFTAATRVRVPSGSPPLFAVSIWRHSSAGRALASHARGHRFEFCCLHQNERTSLRMSFRFGFRSLWSLHPSVVQMLRAAKPPLRNSPPLARLRIYAPPGAPARRPVGPLFLSRLQQLRAARQMSFSLGAAGRGPSILSSASEPPPQQLRPARPAQAGQTATPGRERPRPARRSQGRRSPSSDTGSPM